MGRKVTAVRRGPKLIGRNVCGLAGAKRKQCLLLLLRWPRSPPRKEAPTKSGKRRGRGSIPPLAENVARA